MRKKYVTLMVVGALNSSYQKLLQVTNRSILFFKPFVVGIELSPRIDVAELEDKYVITVEVSSVSIRDIRVEVYDQK